MFDNDPDRDRDRNAYLPNLKFALFALAVVAVLWWFLVLY